MIENRNYWEGLPEELILTCMCSKREGANDQIGFVIDYLKSHMRKGAFFNGIEPVEFLHFAARALEYAFFPLHIEVWAEFADDLSQILDRYEDLLQLAEDKGCQEWIHTDVLRQKWNIFKSVLLMVSEDFDGLESQLVKVLEDSEKNVKAVLGNEEAEINALEDDGDGQYHYPTLWTDIIQPINWLAKESFSGKPRQIFTRIYEDYCLFLDQLEHNTTSHEVVNSLRSRAEKHLRKLCLEVLDEVEVCLETLGEENPGLITVKECFEEMLCSNRERSIAISKESADQQADSEKNENVDESTYLQKDGGFSQHLYEMMTENRSLPVAIMPCLMFSYDDHLDCSVVNIRDHKTGKIREKVLLIHNADENISVMMDDDLIELPFS